MNFRLNRVFPFIPSFLLAVLAGCSLPIDPPKPDAVRYFSIAAREAVPPGSPLRVQVRLAGHLLPRSMAVRAGENEIRYLESERWAEPLQEGITSRLRNALSGVKVEGDLVVEITRFEAISTADNSVEISASYTFTSKIEGAKVGGSFAATNRGDDKAGTEGLVRAYLNGLEQLASEIRAKIER